MTAYEMRISDWSSDVCSSDLRLFLFARRDGEPIVWPEPTHFKQPARGQKRWRAAAERIDWSIPCPSIFERKRPLADATMRRVARGLKRAVIDAADRKSVGKGKRGSGRDDLGGRRII